MSLHELNSLMGAVLAKHSNSAAVRSATDSPRGYDERLWALLCEQVGVPALSVPEEYDGAGFGFAETAVCLERLGEHLTPSPLLGQTVAVEALLATGDTDACARILPGVAAGTSVLGLAWSGCEGLDRDGGLRPPTVTESDGRLDGRVDLVVDGDIADVLLAAAQTPTGVALFDVAGDAAGLTRTHLTTVDQTLRLASVRLDSVRATRVGGDAAAALDRAITVALAAVATTQVGVAQRGLDMTVAYAKERVQFGRQIGSFQALKHRMADMLVAVETSRSAAQAAVAAVADGDTGAGRAAAVAKAWCSDSLELVAAETIQLHGGIAITWEHDAHLVFKKAHALGQLYGGARQHRARVLAP